MTKSEINVEDAEVSLEKTKISKTKRALHVFSWFVISFTLMFMLLIIFWLVYPYKTAYLKEPIEVLNKDNEVAVGEPLYLKVEVVKYAEVYPERTEYISCDDSTLSFIEPSGIKNVPPGTYTIYNNDVIIPAKLTPGTTCRFHFQYAYRVNPIRVVVNEWNSEPFLILPEREAL